MENSSILHGALAGAESFCHHDGKPVHFTRVSEGDDEDVIVRDGQTRKQAVSRTARAKAQIERGGFDGDKTGLISGSVTTTPNPSRA